MSLLATPAPYADEQTVYPVTPLPPDTGTSALSFTVPMDAPGLVFLCRDSGSGSTPTLSTRRSPLISMSKMRCASDSVEIPKRNVFLNGNLDVYNKVMGKSM